MRAAQSRQAQGARPLEQGRPLRRPLVGRGWSVRSIAVVKHTRVPAWQARPHQTMRIVCSGALGSPVDLTAAIEDPQARLASAHTFGRPRRVCIAAASAVALPMGRRC